jgi:hypothetical protein
MGIDCTGSSSTGAALIGLAIRESGPASSEKRNSVRRRRLARAVSTVYGRVEVNVADLGPIEQERQGQCFGFRLALCVDARRSHHSYEARSWARRERWRRIPCPDELAFRFPIGIVRQSLPEEMISHSARFYTVASQQPRMCEPNTAPSRQEGKQSVPKAIASCRADRRLSTSRMPQPSQPPGPRARIVL